MYDEIIATINVTADEMDIIKLALERYQETTVSVGETYTIERLLDKFDK